MARGIRRLGCAGSSRLRGRGGGRDSGGSCTFGVWHEEDQEAPKEAI